eukprot:638873-Rhodomonas_salina.1
MMVLTSSATLPSPNHPTIPPLSCSVIRVPPGVTPPNSSADVGLGHWQTPPQASTSSPDWTVLCDSHGEVQVQGASLSVIAKRRAE